MIQEHLTSRFKLGKLYNSWLIQADNLSIALAELKEFIVKELLNSKLALEHNPDFMLIEREMGESNAKNIGVAQIRRLQEFLYKTAGLSGSKVAIIFEADLMNLNSANALLKILEDTPKNSYIFLITKKAASILSTIRSRCAALNFRSSIVEQTDENYIKYISMLDRDTNFEEKWNVIKEFAEKNRGAWVNFADSILKLIAKITKESAGALQVLSPLESKIMQQFPQGNPEFMLEKYEHSRELVDNTIMYDLDLRASTVLLINVMSM